MAARLRLTFIAVGVFRIFNKTVKLFFITTARVLSCWAASGDIYARTLTCPQHAQKACAWFLLFTKNIHIRGERERERDEPDFSARVDIHFKVVVQSPSKDSSKTRSQPRELVEIEYYCATKKQQYITVEIIMTIHYLPPLFFFFSFIENEIFPDPQCVLFRASLLRLSIAHVNCDSLSLSLSLSLSPIVRL